MAGRSSTTDSLRPAPADAQPAATLGAFDALVEQVRQQLDAYASAHGLSPSGEPMRAGEASSVEPRILDLERQPAGDALLETDQADAGAGPSDAMQEAEGSEVTASAAALDPHAASDTEESIEDYMTQLMARVRSVSGDIERQSGPGDSRKAPAAPQENASTAQKSRDGKTAAEGPARDQPARSLADLATKAAPAESPADLKAMRALANENARRAIESHARKRLLASIYGKLSIAVTASAASFLLIGCSFLQGPRLGYIAAALSLIVALCFSLQYFHLTKALVLLTKQTGLPALPGGPAGPSALASLAPLAGVPTAGMLQGQAECKG